MSHVTTYSQKIKDLDLFLSLAAQYGIVTIGGCEVNLFTTPVKAIAKVHLEGWAYPLAITKDGEVLYDHFGSQSNSMETFHNLLSCYNENVVMKNIPMEIVSSYYLEDIKDGRKLVLEYE